MQSEATSFARHIAPASQVWHSASIGPQRPLKACVVSHASSHPPQMDHRRNEGGYHTTEPLRSGTGDRPWARCPSPEDALYHGRRPRLAGRKPNGLRPLPASLGARRMSIQVWRDSVWHATGGLRYAQGTRRPLITPERCPQSTSLPVIEHLPRKPEASIASFRQAKLDKRRQTVQPATLSCPSLAPRV